MINEFVSIRENIVENAENGQTGNRQQKLNLIQIKNDQNSVEIELATENHFDCSPFSLARSLSLYSGDGVIMMRSAGKVFPRS